MERQLLFLLDYDLRMDEPELLEHFQPFLRSPVASTSSRRVRAAEPSHSIEGTKSPLQYPITPRRAPACEVGLLTPSPSPTRPSRASHSSAPAIPTRRVGGSQQRVSPSGSSSSGETMSDDLGSDSGEELMDLDHQQPSSHYSSSIPATQQQSRSSAKYAGNAPSSYRRSKTSSAPVTPTDEISSYALHSGYATPGSDSNSPSRRPLEPTLRNQRSGSFLRMTYEAGKGMLGGNRSSKLLRDGVDLHDVRLV